MSALPTHFTKSGDRCFQAKSVPADVTWYGTESLDMRAFAQAKLSWEEGQQQRRPLLTVDDGSVLRQASWSENDQNAVVPGTCGSPPAVYALQPTGKVPMYIKLGLRSSSYRVATVQPLGQEVSPSDLPLMP